MTVTVRFAPSPTGLLHIGNARMALVNWLYARRHKGRFVLRLDDTDKERSTSQFAAAIEADLNWLELGWDRLEKQSARLAVYDAALERLKNEGRVYPCFESAETLEYKRRRALTAGKPPIYDRAALDLSEVEIADKLAAGEHPHWRFKLHHSPITFQDAVRGAVSFHGARLSDPVLVRADGSYLYMLPSTVDDRDLDISHVIRGEDHVSNSAIQIQLFEALDAPVPVFAHLSLLTDVAGGGLSKRAGSLSLQDLRGQGMEAMTVNSLLASLGTSDDITPCQHMDQLVQTFDLGHFGRATPKFDPARLWALNAELLHQTPFHQVEARLNGMGAEQADAEFWAAVRPNLDRLDHALVWHTVCYEHTPPAIDALDESFMETAKSLLPPEPWNANTWAGWTATIKQATGRKGRDLFLPLRLALTGLDHGPELKALLPLMGFERVHNRLSGKTG